MKRRIAILLLAAGITHGLALTGLAGEKAEAPKADTAKKEAPVMAGFGMIAPKHMCTEAYGECMQGCGKTGGANCQMECVSDCNVCALDFGEEALDVCRQ